MSWVHLRAQSRSRPNQMNPGRVGKLCGLDVRAGAVIQHANAACSAALFVRVDWVSKRPSELYPRSALIPEAFDFGAGVPNPTQ